MGFMRKSSHSFQEILEEPRLKEFSLLDISSKSYRLRVFCFLPDGLVFSKI
jgi:hypothetical protein